MPNHFWIFEMLLNGGLLHNILTNRRKKYVNKNDDEKKKLVLIEWNMNILNLPTDFTNEKSENKLRRKKENRKRKTEIQSVYYKEK